MKMKFVINHLNQKARTGFLKEIERMPGVVYETPLLLHYTKGANLPHITREVFEMITKNPEAISVSLTSTMTFLKSLEDFKDGIAKFAAMGDCLTYLSFQDTGVKSVEGHSDKNNIPLWTRHGKVLFDPTKYIDIISKFKPDIYHTLCDDNTGPNSSEKHLTKAVSKSNEMFNKCMELHVDNKWLMQNCFVLAAVTGGYSKNHCENSLKCILESKYFSSVGGILINGLQANGPFNENLGNEDFYKIIEYVISNSPPSLLRSVSGSFPPIIIMKLISLGIDVFDTSYANNATERNCALTFSFESKNQNENEAEINLADDKYKEDFTPLLNGCQCLACNKHTKAYVNHLTATKELLGSVLLAIHNTHHYMKFFETIRKNITENNFDSLKQHIEMQYEKNS